MLQLNNLESTSKKRKRIGRGGDKGGTSGRGHKGQKARTGAAGELTPFFEGGQMPLTRRLPKRGFVNAFKKEIVIINLRDLESKFDNGQIVDKKVLFEKNLIKGKRNFLVKILGNGHLSKKLTVKADLFSKSAMDAIQKVGGKAEVIQVEQGD